MYAALSPWPIPPALARHKVANLGDGLILRAIERHLGRGPAAPVVSPRVAPGASELDALEQAGLVVLAGANQLHDRYTLWPGCSIAALRARAWRFVPFGLGVHGAAGFNDAMSEETQAMLTFVHERIEYSSWRCPRTVAYLTHHLPALTGRALMTGCPVLYDRPLLERERFPEGGASIAVTVTERGDFWQRESRTLEWVARRYRRARRHLVLHQDFARLTPMHVERRGWGLAPRPAREPLHRLRALARRLGFDVVIPDTIEAAITFYDTVDLHVGSRLHAHLYCLSRNVRSVLTPVDGRAPGIAEAFDFPLTDPGRLDEGVAFDLERVRARARAGFGTLQRFLASLA